MTIPFTIDRQSDHSLTEQVTRGFLRSIQSGHYKPDAKLPNLRDIAGELGVSLEVSRKAVQRLVREGFVTARPKLGIQVCTAGGQRWLSHVLFLHMGSASSYYEAVFNETLTQWLLVRNILVTSICVSGADKRKGHALLRSAIRSAPVGLAALVNMPKDVGVLLAENDIPFVYHGRHPGQSDGAALPLARRVLVMDYAPALKQAVKHAIDCGARNLMVVDYRLPEHQPRWEAIIPVAEAAGLSVRMLLATPVKALKVTENVERGGLVAMERFLRSKEPLPDMVYFSDDFLAQGGLTALLAQGIRIPEQVQVMTWANSGSGPVFPRPLTRVEMDPVRDGELFAELVVATIKSPGRKVREPSVISPSFIVGETTLPGKTRKHSIA